MTTVVLTSDVLGPIDLKETLDSVQYFASVLKPGTLITLTPTEGADVIHITEANRHIGASGYHIVVNGAPTAFCSLRAAGRLEGHYSPALWKRGIKLLGKVVTQPKLIHGEEFTPGLITVVCHELAEMFADGNIATYTAEDSQGRQWLKEPCDWVFGTYMVHTINGKVVVFPNVALDSFSTLGAPAPYDLCGIVKAPFEMTPKGYAYYRGINGVNLKV